MQSEVALAVDVESEVGDKVEEPRGNRKAEPYIWLGTFGAFLVTVALYYPAFVEEFWIYVDPVEGMASEGNHFGLWNYCNSSIYQCNGYHNDYLTATQALMIMTTAGMLISGIFYMIPCIAALGQLFAGVMSLAGVSVYGSENSAYNVSWCFGFAATTTCILLINGLILLVFLGMKDIKRMFVSGGAISSELKTCCCSCKCCRKSSEDEEEDETETVPDIEGATNPSFEQDETTVKVEPTYDFETGL